MSDNAPDTRVTNRAIDRVKYESLTGSGTYTYYDTESQYLHLTEVVKDMKQRNHISEQDKNRLLNVLGSVQRIRAIMTQNDAHMGPGTLAPDNNPDNVMNFARSLE
jgi:hypothetical protein